MSTAVRKFSSPDLDQLYQEWYAAPFLKLPPKCRIVVAGAFEGRVMRLLAEMFPGYREMIGFEPQKWAAARCYDNVKKYPNMNVVASGLLADSRIYEHLPMGEFGTDACSMLGAPREQGEGVFTDAYVQLSHSIPIDLLVMNLEGYEYRLLPYLAKRGPDYIRQFAVQFHTKYEVSPDDTLSTLTNMNVVFGEPVYNDYPRWVLWRGPAAA